MHTDRGSRSRAPKAVRRRRSRRGAASPEQRDRGLCPSVNREHRAADLLAFKANFRDASLAAGLLPVLAFDGGYGGMVVADDGVATLACCIRRDRLDAARRAAPGRRAGEVVEAWLRRECRGVASALAGAQRDGPWLAAGPLDAGHSCRAAATRGSRIGNAAGEAHPIIGEGLSIAMQSAWLLCARLVEARALDAREAACGRARGACSRDEPAPGSAASRPPTPPTGGAISRRACGSPRPSRSWRCGLRRRRCSA